MRDRVVKLSGPQAKRFCVALWNEPTVVGRCIWSDDKLDLETKFSALKWLNEIQHRVWGAHARDDQDALGWLLDRIISHCDREPKLRNHVRVALDRSIASVSAVDC
jgi:hypothetical protein